MSNSKITNKFIPKTNSHTSSRINRIITNIKEKKKVISNTKEILEPYKKRTGIKTYKRRFKAKLFKEIKQNKNNQNKQNKQNDQNDQNDNIKHQDIKHQDINQNNINTDTNTNTISQINNKNIVIPKIEDIVINEMENINTLNKYNKINKMNKYIIAIPSYNRSDLIQVKTLALLHKHNINPKIINIFVADRDQYDLYKSKIPSFLYNKLIIGVKGLKNQRNYITNYYPEGYHIVEMDDDIEKIVQLIVKYKSISKASSSKGKTSKGKTSKGKTSKGKTTKIIKSLIPIVNLEKFIITAFERCHNNGIFLWGIYPLANAHFMTDTITTDLRFIVGPMFGIINRHRPDLQITIDEKENSERTLQHWVIDGSVLRFNNIGVETKYYKNKGGMQNEGKNRKEEALKSVYYLHKKYPTITKINLGKKSGMPEIKLKSK